MQCKVKVLQSMRAYFLRVITRFSVRMWTNMIERHFYMKVFQLIGTVVGYIYIAWLSAMRFLVHYFCNWQIYAMQNVQQTQ